jgi:hypothetical protein
MTTIGNPRQSPPRTRPPQIDLVQAEALKAWSQAEVELVRARRSLKAALPIESVKRQLTVKVGRAEQKAFAAQAALAQVIRVDAEEEA